MIVLSFFTNLAFPLSAFDRFKAYLRETYRVIHASLEVGREGSTLRSVRVVAM